MMKFWIENCRKSDRRISQKKVIFKGRELGLKDSGSFAFQERSDRWMK